ncbi:MAG: NAD(P)-binding protein [Myxococcota bacterium]
MVGAGFGGLAAALRLAELGADVVLCETLRYPGGCASTFSRSGYQFEAGATLFSGLGPGQLFSRWNDKWDLGVQFDPLDPMVDFRTSTWSLEIPPDPERLLQRFLGLPGADETKLRAFFAMQRKVAGALWALFDDPALLPPLGFGGIARHLGRSMKYAPVVRWMGRSLGDVAAHHGLAQWQPLKTYLDAVSQITVQASADEAEAPFAMAAIDYFFRGTGHVRGGIGSLAWGLVAAIERAGGRVMLSNRARQVVRGPRGWQVHTRQGVFETPTVVGNVLPQSMTKLGDASLAGSTDDIASAVESGWGAAMLYMAVRDEALDGPEAHHLQLVHDDAQPFREGNHVFCSVSAGGETARAPEGERTVTVSTHIPMEAYLSYDDAAQGEYIASVQQAMRETIALRAPELAAHKVFEMTASPRTFARFTGRHDGFVGGIPRRVGLQHYRPKALWPRQVARGLYLVGDSVLLGQSTLAVALGGVRTAETIAG